MDAQLFIENFRAHLKENISNTRLALAVFGSEEEGDFLLYLYDQTELSDLMSDEEQEDARTEFKLIDPYYHLEISVGMIGAQKPYEKAKGECYGSWEIYRSAVHSKWKGKGIGKMLYEMAMALAGGPIMSDRFSVSDSAQNIWKSLEKTSRKTGDFDNVENPQTPPQEDDCIVGRNGTTNWGLEIDPSKRAAIERKIQLMSKKHKNFVKQEIQPWIGWNERAIDMKFRTAALDLFRKEYYEG